MPDFQSDRERNFFRVWIQRVNTLYDSFEKRLQDHVAGQLALGRTSKDVISELEANLNNGQAIFKELMSGVEKEMDYGLNLEYQLASNVGELPKGSEMVKWTLDPAAEHCKSCLAQAAMEPRDIATIPIPGTQPTVDGDNCENYCRCSLVPVNALQEAA